MNLYINTQAKNASNPFVKSLATQTPVALPELILGDKQDIKVYFVDGAAYADFSGDANYTVKVAVGGARVPTGGTWNLVVEGTPTSNLAFDITPAELSTVLGVTVTGVAGSYYKVGYGAGIMVTGDGAGLSPESNVIVTDLGNGSRLIQLRQNPIAYAELTATTDGFVGTLDLLTLGAVQRLLDENRVLETFEVEVTRPDGTRKTYAQAGVLVKAEIIDQDAAAGAAKPTLITMAEALAMFEGADTQKVNTETLIADAALGTKRFQYLAASGADRTVTLPAGTGYVYYIKNIGADNNIIVNNSSAVMEVTLYPGWEANLVSNADGWEITVVVPEVIETIAANHSVTNETLLLVTASSNITLPNPALRLGVPLRIKNVNATTVNLLPFAAETIEDASVIDTLTVYTDGTNWYTL